MVRYFQFYSLITQHDPISLIQSRKGISGKAKRINTVSFLMLFSFYTLTFLSILVLFLFLFFFLLRRCIDGIFICHKYCTFGHIFNGYTVHIDRRFQFYANKCVIHALAPFVSSKRKGEIVYG